MHRRILFDCSAANASFFAVDRKFALRRRRRRLWASLPHISQAFGMLCYDFGLPNSAWFAFPAMASETTAAQLPSSFPPIGKSRSTLKILGVRASSQRPAVLWGHDLGRILGLAERKLARARKFAHPPRKICAAREKKSWPTQEIPIRTGTQLRVAPKSLGPQGFSAKCQEILCTLNAAKSATPGVGKMHCRKCTESATAPNMQVGCIQHPLSWPT